MVNRLTTGMLCLSLASYCYTANAGQPDVANMPNEHQGFYLTGDLGAILTDQLISNDPDNPEGVRLNGFGLGGAAGYMFNPYIGLEANIYGSVADTSLRTNNLTLFWYGGALKLNWPIADHFAFFVKGGVGGLYTSYDLTIFDIKAGSITMNTVGGIVGGGIGYSINQNSEVTLETNGIIIAPKDENGVRSCSYISLLGVAYTYHF